MKFLKVFEDFNQQTANPECKTPWPALAPKIKGSTIMNTNYEFTGYIEGKEAQGAIFTDTKTKNYVEVAPDRKYTIYKPDPSRKEVGIEVSKGNWNCLELPGGGTKIMLK